MATKDLGVPEVLDRLEAFHGPQEPRWPVDPYEFLVWWHCGYPASDAACEHGWQALKKITGIEPESLLAAPQNKVTEALKAGGMVPEIRAVRLREVAQRVLSECSGDLRGAIAKDADAARTLLKKFPGIADPGVDRILLFARAEAVAAVPSNCPHVLVRIRNGDDGHEYGAAYRQAQWLIEREVAGEFAARMRAYLLLKTHGQTLCKRNKPKCGECPLQSKCAHATPEQDAAGEAT